MKNYFMGSSLEKMLGTLTWGLHYDVRLGLLAYTEVTALSGTLPVTETILWSFNQ